MGGGASGAGNGEPGGPEVVGVRTVLVTVGDELLLGQTVNTNAAWLARELWDLGVEVVRSVTVGDGKDEIRAAVEEACGTGDLVIVTGGLGPTEDDRTREAVATLFGRELKVDERLLRLLERRFEEAGFGELPPRNVSQAEVPRGAEALPNPHGTAPGLVLDEEGVTVALLPGVPREMRGIFRESLSGRLRETFRRRLRAAHHRVIHTTGIAESVLAERVDEQLPGETGPVSVAFLPDERGVDLRLTVRGVTDEEEAGAWLDRVEEALEPVVRKYRFEAPETGDLVEAVARALESSGWTLAVAESCTGGLVAKRLTDRAGSSAYFAGGVVAYDDRIKVELLDVDPAVLEERGAVSEEVARALALGVARRLDTDAGVGITGIAGPGGGTEEKPVGTVSFAACVGGEVETRIRRFPGDRESVRERSGQAALALLLRLLERRS